MNLASCQFLEQIYFRSCALRCGQTSNDSNEDKRICVEGCRLAKGKPLNAALLAFSLFGIEEESVHESVLSELETRAIGGRLQSISQGIQHACARECDTYCKQRGEKCQRACVLGCSNFVKPMQS